ncbi:RDD family protein [uncultured Microbacterium sp.]|uniref:RDD family protein n=1 Tax=uncultured Microbacterium sp. TaxID=191216 RepID=UPI0025E26F37|nr:RDD family protein [uncultured Microbacterium sp.]
MSSATTSATAATTTPRIGANEIVRVEQDEILTGEAVALDVQPAGFFLRTAGAAIDLLVSIVLLIGASIFISGVGYRLVGDDGIRILVIGTAVLITVAIPVTVETATRGRSLGKLAIGARIVRSDGGSAGFRQALIRALIGLLEIYMTLGSIALLTAVFTPRSQRLGDLAAGTYSQRVRTARPAEPLPPLAPELTGWASVADVARLPDRTARRLAQFLHQIDKLEPRARDRVANELMSDVAPFVAPLPPVPPVPALFAIAAVRRTREERALAARAARLERLAPGLGRD